MSELDIPPEQVQLILEEGQELHVDLIVPVHLTIEKRQTELPDNKEVQITLRYDGWYLTDPITATKPVESLYDALMHFGITRASNYTVQPKAKYMALDYEEGGDE
jgi:hypothetical protein